MRLFLALALPSEVRAGIAETVSRLRGELHGWRFAPLEQVHLTMRFLGDSEPDLLQEGQGGWREAAGSVPPIRLVLTRLSAFPSPRRARVLWLGVEERDSGGALLQLHREVEQRARRLGYPAEARAFRPHLTLARSRNPRQLPALDAVSPGELSFRVDALRLYRSHPGPAGARHEELSVFPLSGSDGCSDGGRVST